MTNIEMGPQTRNKRKSTSCKRTQRADTFSSLMQMPDGRGSSRLVPAQSVLKATHHQKTNQSTVDLQFYSPQHQQTHTHTQTHVRKKLHLSICTRHARAPWISDGVSGSHVFQHEHHLRRQSSYCKHMFYVYCPLHKQPLEDLLLPPCRKHRLSPTVQS